MRASEPVSPIENESNFLPFKGRIKVGMGLIAERTHPHPIPLLEGEGDYIQGG
jgi:hypothetical protein